MSNRPRLQLFLARLSWPIFGLALLGFLTAIEHQSWFELKPATGTAVAMSRAASAS